MATALAALVPLAACAPDDAGIDTAQAPGTTAVEPLVEPIPTPVTPADISEEFVEGELTRVEPAEQVFVLTGADGVELEFRYSEATEVRDDGTLQGLADTEGSRVRVYHDGDPDQRTAIRITVIPEGESGAPSPTLP
jgi:hypothetical protein